MGGDITAAALQYVSVIQPLLLIFGGIAFADLTIGFLMKLFKQMRAGKVKW